MRTAADVRSYFLSNWRELVPEIIVTGVRVAGSRDDADVIEVELLGQPGASIQRLILVPASSSEPRQVRGLLPRMRRMASGGGVWAGLLVPHMGAAGARLCREAGIGFLDCCGNAHMRFNHVLVQISGQRNRFTERKQVRTLFHDKATIPLRVMLQAPGEWMTTREIAERGGLSLGWVSQILQQMHAEGYIERQRGGGSRLVRPQQLVADWLEEYAFDVNELFPFQLKDDDLEGALQRLRTVNARLADRYALTLQSAVHALELAPKQRRLPYDLHIYIPELNEDLEDTLETWRRVLGLRPAGHGANCFLVKPAYRHAIFFDAQASQGLRSVSDLQLYMDLYHHPDSRERARNQLARRLHLDVG
jgi:hypothetical protein